jgi:Arc/MetJ-type ribon-helix-helix transcriptional regulator
LSDYVGHTRDLVKQLKIRANASHTTRSALAHLNEMNGDIWQHLRMMREEIAELKAILENQPIETNP